METTWHQVWQRWEGNDLKPLGRRGLHEMCDDLSFRAAQEVLRPCRDVLGQGSASVLSLLVTECLMSVSAKQGPSPWSPKGILLVQTSDCSLPWRVIC